MRRFIAALLMFAVVFGFNNVVASPDRYQTPVFFGPTTPSDNLYRIAIQLKPSFLVTEEQVMIALLKYNPEAFDVQNINAIKPGKVLRLPSLKLIRDIAPRFAHYEVKRQNADWKERIEKDTKKNTPVLQDKTELNTTTIARTTKTKIQATAAASPEKVKPAPKVESKSAEEPKGQYSTPALDSRISTLELQNSTLQGQLTTMGHQLNAIQQQIIQLKTPKVESSSLPIKLDTTSVKSFIVSMQNKLGTLGFILTVIFGFLFIIFFLRGLFAGASKRKASLTAAVAPTVNKEEYDFLGSEESIPAKLNLAHAYLEMGNHIAARDVLNEVILKGDLAQQAEARELLNKIAK